MTEPSEEMVERVETAMLAELRRQGALHLACVSDTERDDCRLLDGEFDLTLLACAAISAMQVEGIDQILNNQTAESKPGGYDLTERTSPSIVILTRPTSL